MKIRMNLFLIMFLSIGLSGCDLFKSSKLTWNSSQRDLTYSLIQQQVDAAGNLTLPVKEDVLLRFGPQRGNVDLIYNNKVTQSKISVNGVLRPVDPTESYFFWESIFLSVLPPDGKVKENKSWKVKRPSDLEVRNSDAFIAQSEITYTIKSVSPYVVAYSGEMRIASTKALDEMADNYGIPPVLARALAAKPKPFLLGEAEFSNQEGNTISSEGVVRPFAALGNSDEVATHPARIEYKIVKK